MEPFELAPILIAAIAAIIDLRTRRIPNLLTLGGALAGFVVNTAVGGLAGLGHAAGGWATGIAIFFPMFLLRGMGAGDVKLLGAIGSWVGPVAALWTGFYSVMAGGILALVVGAWHGYLGKAFANVWALIGFWRAAGVRPLPGLTLGDAPGPRLAYGVAIAVGTLAAVWLK